MPKFRIPVPDAVLRAVIHAEAGVAEQLAIAPEACRRATGPARWPAQRPRCRTRSSRAGIPRPRRRRRRLPASRRGRGRAPRAGRTPRGRSARRRCTGHSPCASSGRASGPAGRIEPDQAAGQQRQHAAEERHAVGASAPG